MRTKKLMMQYIDTINKTTHEQKNCTNLLSDRIKELEECILGHTKLHKLCLHGIKSLTAKHKELEKLMEQKK